ncbi:MAG: hypothetical protein NVSMB32_00680 [Actinomycetota bacterium]
MVAELVVYDLHGPRGQACVVADPSLAVPVPEVHCFWDFSDELGARIGLWTPEKVVIASFPGWDHADCEIARMPDGWVPLADGGGRWEDLDQSWFLSTTEQEGWVYVFQSELDLLTQAVEGTVVATATAKPGTLMVNGAEATWYRVPVDTFRAAWAQAQGQARRIVGSRGGGS